MENKTNNKNLFYKERTNMKRIKLNKLNDIIVSDTYEPNSFIGFDVIKNKDINGVEYELKNNEEKYYFFNKFGSSLIFISESHLLNVLLGEYIDDIESGNIYDHGYPESRLIPSNHHEKCQEYCLEHILGDISDKVKNIISEYFR